MVAPRKSMMAPRKSGQESRDRAVRMYWDPLATRR